METISNAKEAGECLTRHGVLVSAGPAGLTSVMTFNDGRVGLYALLTETELIELARIMQRRLASDGESSAGLGDENPGLSGDLASHGQLPADQTRTVNGGAS